MSESTVSTESRPPEDLEVDSRDTAQRHSRGEDRHGRLRELLAIPEHERSDTVWDEIVELEIEHVPVNPLRSPSETPVEEEAHEEEVRDRDTAAQGLRERSSQPERDTAPMQARAMRDTERIGQIRTPGNASTRQVVLHSKRACRVLRRDYNIVATKMFFARGSKAGALAEALSKLEHTCFELQTPPQHGPAIQAPEWPAQTFAVRVIHPFARRYLACIVRFDALERVLAQARASGSISAKTRRELLDPCLDWLLDVKAIALDFPVGAGRRASRAQAHARPEAGPSAEGANRQ